MIFKPLRQLSPFVNSWIIVAIIFLSPNQVISNILQQYPFEKSQEVLIADSLFQDGLYKSAIDFYKQASDGYREDKNWEGVIYSLNKIGWAKIADSQEVEGYDILQESSRLIAEHDLQKSVIKADNYLYRGIYLSRTGRFDSARYYHEKDISLRKRIQGERSESLAESFRHYGQCLADYGNLSQGEKYLRESIEIFADYHPRDHLIFGKLYGTLSSILRRKYDYENAVLYAEMSIDILNKAGDSQINSYVISLITLGNIHNSFKKFDNAFSAYNETLKVIKDHPEVNNEYLIYFFYPNLASLYNQVNKPDSALYYVNLSQELLIKFKLQDIGFGWTSWFDLIAGEAYSFKSEYDMAKKLAFNTLGIYEDIFMESSADLATINQVIAKIYQGQNYYDSALFYYQKALTEFLPNFDNRNIYSNPDNGGRTDVLFLYDLLYGKADVFRNYFLRTREEKYLKTALEIYNLIDKINDDIRNSKMAEGSLLAINELFRADYEKGIDCAFELNKLTRDNKYLHNAFKLIEKSKYMLLLKSLSAAEYYDASASIDLKNIEDSLKSQYINYQLQIESENTKDVPDSTVLAELTEKRNQYGIELDNFKMMVTEKYPNYAMVKYDTLIKTYQDFKTYCAENDLLGIEFYWGLKNTYVVTTNNFGSEVYKVELNDSIRMSISVLQNQLSKGFSMSTSKIDFTEFTYHSYQLYKKLLREAVNGYPKDQQILIIPDGPLSQLPFEILLTEKIADDYVDYQNLPYLINTYYTGYAYSANLLLAKPLITGQSSNRLVAFSYSKINADQNDEGRSAAQEELHHAAIELRAIRKEMGRKKSRYYYGMDATESEFKRIASNYHIIHLAVHGESDTTSSMNTKLIFKNELDTLEDGELYMHELFGLDLSHTELAVLSACETGIGKSYTGEGVFSMARGFAYAGCPSIVMSLWRVDDRFTSQLMKNFYKNLKKGENIAESLTNSKRQFIDESGENGAHPSNWAAFVPVGKNSVIEKSSGVFYYIIILIFIIAFIVIYLRVKK